MVKGKKIIFMTIIFFICLIIFLFSAFKVIKIKINEKKESENFEILRKYVSGDDKDYVKNEKIENNNYKNIHKLNNDLVGWISIPDTPIDYPVMSTPKDPNYYLRRNFDKRYSISGTPFIGDGLSPVNKSFIVYAHNMKNDTMFGTLENYKNIDYKNSHKYIIFNTLYEKRKYEVIGAFHVEIDERDPNLFKYYNYSGDLDKEKMEEFIHEISKISIYGNIKNTTYEDQIMMLSTCSYFSDKGRFVVVARKLDSIK